MFEKLKWVATLPMLASAKSQKKCKIITLKANIGVSKIDYSRYISQEFNSDVKEKERLIEAAIVKNL